LLEFPRFAGFNIRTNKRCLLTWIELFTALLDAETKKMGGESGKKKTSFESSKVIQQCQSIIEICDLWNWSDWVLKRPDFQIHLSHRIRDKLFECDPRTKSPTYKTPNLEKIWADRLMDLCMGTYVHHKSVAPEGGLDLSNDAMSLLMLLKDKCPTRFIRTYCLIPLTEDEEKYLVERRKKIDEKMRSKNKTSTSNTRTLPKVKRGIKARAAREAATKEKHRERERRRKRKMWYLMQNYLFHIFKASQVELTFTTFAKVAQHVFRSKLNRRQPAMNPITFKDWRNIDLLIQLIKVEALSKCTQDKLTFQLNKTSLSNIAASKEESTHEAIEMSKEEALDALRTLRNKLRRDPEYFNNM